MRIRYLTKMTRKGQITVPAQVREALGLKVGDQISVRVNEEQGTATIEAADSIVGRLYGVFASKSGRGVKDVDAAIREAAAQAAIDRDERTKRG